MINTNRVNDLFLNKSYDELKRKSFASDIISSKINLTDNEFSTLVKFIVANNDPLIYRDAWRMTLYFSHASPVLCEIANKDLQQYQADNESTGYENNIDLKLKYVAKYGFLRNEIIDKFSGIPVGALNLIIFEYLFDNEKIDEGLFTLIRAIAFSKQDHSTRDSADIWLGEIASQKINTNLKKILQQANIENTDPAIIAALKYAIDQTDL